MFKSASTSQFENTPFANPSYSTLTNSMHDNKSPLEYRPKKAGVKFEVEKDKENTLKKEFNLQHSPVKRSDKHNKTWASQRFITEAEHDNSKPALKQLLGGFNYKKQLPKHQQSHQMTSSGRFCQTDKFGLSSKKNIPSESRKYLEEPGKVEKSFNQCKSMKIIPSFNADQDTDFAPYRPKKIERKFQKLEAYNDLLKQSENLIEKYKKIEEEKSRLRNDLKNQIQHSSKSSKKITFLQETQMGKKYEKLDQPNVKAENKISSYLFDSQSPKTKDYSVSRKYGNYESYQSPHLETKYQIKVTKSPSTYESSKSLSKTFSSFNNSSSSEQKQTVKTFTSSLTSSSNFGLSRTASSKKISPTGMSLDDFELGKCLGSGAFGQVFPAKHKKTGWLFALKKVPKQKVKYMLDQFITQIKIQLFLDHPNVVKLYSFFDDTLHFYILMEYMQGGSLYSYLKKQKTLSLQQTSTKLRQVCEGLKHMHQNQILHRDIKPENIVMCHNVSKLCDFGWSAICKDRRTTYCGTLDYVSPQIIGGDGYDDSVDIWCIGVLTYELIVGKTPFFNISRKETMKKILDCNLQYPSTMPQVAVKFVKNILRKNPEHRQTIEQILKDPLLKISQNTNSIF